MLLHAAFGVTATQLGVKVQTVIVFESRRYIQERRCGWQLELEARFICVVVSTIQWVCDEGRW